MKKTSELLTGLALVAVAAFALISLAAFAADQIYSTSFNTKVTTTKSLGSFECFVGVTPDGVTNITYIVSKWTASTSDTNGNTYASSSGNYTLYRTQVWAAASSGWRTGMTNAWDGQIDAFPARILALWAHPEYLNP